MENSREADAFDARAGRPDPRDPASVAEARRLLLGKFGFPDTEAGRIYRDAQTLLLDISRRYFRSGQNTSVEASPAAALLRRLDFVRSRPSKMPNSPRRYRPTPEGMAFADEIRQVIKDWNERNRT